MRGSPNLDTCASKACKKYYFWVFRKQIWWIEKSIPEYYFWVFGKPIWLIEKIIAVYINFNRNSWAFIVGVATNLVLNRKWISTFHTFREFYFVSVYAWHYGEVTIACKNTPLTTWAQKSQCLKASRRYCPPLWFVRPTFLLTIRGISFMYLSNKIYVANLIFDDWGIWS